MGFSIGQLKELKMPTWCENDITIVGTKTNLTKLIKDAKQTTESSDSELNLNRLYPVPNFLEKIHSGANNINGQRYDYWLEVENETGDIVGVDRDLEKSKRIDIGISEDTAVWIKKMFGGANWYDWQTTNWGVKWGAYEVYSSLNIEKIEGNSKYKLDAFTQCAWGIPDGLFQKICNDYKLIMIIQYQYEGGMEGGWFRIVDEKIEAKNPNLKTGDIEVFDLAEYV